jgi:hypothetical protein
VRPTTVGAVDSVAAHLPAVDPAVGALVRTVSPQINAIGAKFMLHPDTRAVGSAHGVANGFAFYTVGRGGVLGDVDADVVASAFGFFDPGLVRTMWGIGTEKLRAREAAALFAEACRAWGRTHLAGVEGLDRLADLGEKVMEAADVTGLTLFAGWRAEPLPDDAPGRAAQVIHVLREHRGSAHLVAVVATGLKPIEAMVVAQGTERPKLFGWAEPLPSPEDYRHLWEHAERLTDALVAPAYEALDAGEAEEFGELIARVHAAVAGT